MRVARDMLRAEPELRRVLRGLGYAPIRQTGSHRYYESDGHRLPALPIHKGFDVSDNTLRRLAEALGIRKQDLERWSKHKRAFKQATRSGLDRQA